MKYLLLLSFLLAFLPSQNAHEHRAAKAKNFVVVVDHIQSLASSDTSKKADKESEDSHPISASEIDLPSSSQEIVQVAIPLVPSDTTAYYPIRAPPVLA